MRENRKTSEVVFIFVNLCGLWFAELNSSKIKWSKALASYSRKKPQLSVSGYVCVESWTGYKMLGWLWVCTVYCVRVQVQFSLCTSQSKTRYCICVKKQRKWTNTTCPTTSLAVLISTSSHSLVTVHLFIRIITHMFDEWGMPRVSCKCHAKNSTTVLVLHVQWVFTIYFSSVKRWLLTCCFLVAFF